MTFFDNLNKGGALGRTGNPHADAARAAVRLQVIPCQNCFDRDGRVGYLFRAGEMEALVYHMLHTKKPRDGKSWNTLIQRYFMAHTTEAQEIREASGAGLLMWLYDKEAEGNKGILVQIWPRPHKKPCWSVYPRANIPSDCTKERLIKFLDISDIYQLTIALGSEGDLFKGKKEAAKINARRFWLCRYGDIPEKKWLDQDRRSRGVVDMIRCDSTKKWAANQYKSAGKNGINIVEAVLNEIRKNGEEIKL